VRFNPTIHQDGFGSLEEGTKEEEELFYFLFGKQAYLLLLWSLFACGREGYDFFQTLIGG
jgi:hypothetical protein